MPQLTETLETIAEEVKSGSGTSQHRWISEDVLDTLEAIGPDATAAVPLLLKLHSQSKEPYVTLRLARALKKIDPAAAREAGIP